MKKFVAVLTMVFVLCLSGMALSHKKLKGPGEIHAQTLRFHLDTSVLQHKYNLVDEHSEPFHMLWADSPYIGFGFGYTVIDSLVLGARTTFGYRDNNPDALTPDDNYRVRFGFTPYFEYLFFPLEWLSPFVTAQVGVDGVSTPRTNNFDFTVGGGGGLHFFLNPAFSMDLTGIFSYYAPHHALSTNLMFGLSGWL